MRINKYVALATGMSRRFADTAIKNGRVAVNEKVVPVGTEVSLDDIITLDGRTITATTEKAIILINKPAGYVCSRRGQGSKAVYDLLPAELHHLKPVGRLDKDSSGLLLMTNDGALAHKLTHPKFNKEKVYEVVIDKPLNSQDFTAITRTGVNIGDSRLSRLQLRQLETSNQKLADSTKKPIPNSYFLVTLAEGRNRQIRRTFAALGYQVTKLHRIQFGPYRLNDLKPGKYKYL